MKQVVADPDELNGIAFDRILITTINSRESVLQKIMQKNIASELVVEIN